MIKLNNPFVEAKNYNCFACSPNNPDGLKMDFYEDGDEVVSFWEPMHTYEGWQNVLHGGIQTTLMDETASWLIFVKLKTTGVTYRINIKLIKPVYVNKGKITLRASLIEVKRKMAVISTNLMDAEHNLCAEGVIEYFTFPQNIAIEKYGYPGYKSFYSAK